MWIPVTLLFLRVGWWLGNKPHVARTVEINNAEPGNCAAGSTNWFLLLEVWLLNVGTLWEYLFWKQCFKIFWFYQDWAKDK